MYDWSDYNDAKMFYINRTVLNASESKTKESLFEEKCCDIMNLKPK